MYFDWLIPYHFTKKFLIYFAVLIANVSFLHIKNCKESISFLSSTTMNFYIAIMFLIGGLSQVHCSHGTDTPTDVSTAFPTVDASRLSECRGPGCAQLWHVYNWWHIQRTQPNQYGKPAHTRPHLFFHRRLHQPLNVRLMRQHRR